MEGNNNEILNPVERRRFTSKVMPQNLNVNVVHEGRLRECFSESKEHEVSL